LPPALDLAAFAAAAAPELAMFELMHDPAGDPLLSWGFACHIDFSWSISRGFDLTKTASLRPGFRGPGNDDAAPPLIGHPRRPFMAPITKMRIHHFGGKEVLQADTIARSLPDAGQVLVAVHAASLNPVDFKIRSGKYPAVKDDRLAGSPLSPIKRHSPLPDEFPFKLARSRTASLDRGHGSD
jgi:hypothetical protein